MTNGELFIVENPNIEYKLNGSCVWIYFDGVNHYTMPTLWWEQEISSFDKIRAEIDKQIEYNTYFNSDMAKGEIIAFEWVKRKMDEYGKEQEC